MEKNINILILLKQKLLVGYRLKDLGTMTAHLDFPLVSWLRRERNRAACIDDFVTALRQIHTDFSWPYPLVPSVHTRRLSCKFVTCLLKFLKTKSCFSIN